jgi:hypothetical protein
MGNAKSRIDPQRTAENRSPKPSGWTVLGDVALLLPRAVLTCIVLLISAGAVVLALVFCFAVIQGREVTFYPPHIAAYQDPRIVNCNALIAAYPQMIRTTEDELARTRDLLRSDYQAAREYFNKPSALASEKIDIDKRIEHSIKDMDSIRQRLDEKRDQVVQSCRT